MFFLGFRTLHMFQVKKIVPFVLVHFSIYFKYKFSLCSYFICTRDIYLHTNFNEYISSLRPKKQNKRRPKKFQNRLQRRRKLKRKRRRKSRRKSLSGMCKDVDSAYFSGPYFRKLSVFFNVILSVIILLLATVWKCCFSIYLKKYIG